MPYVNLHEKQNHFVFTVNNIYIYDYVYIINVKLEGADVCHWSEQQNTAVFYCISCI